MIGNEESTKTYFSTPELARLLGISRVAVLKKIKSGIIKAEKVGRNYIISRSEFEAIIGRFLSEDRKRDIEKTVEKTIREYGEALRKLGRE